MKQFEKEFVDFLKAKKKDLLPELKEKKQLEDALKEKLVSAIKEFKGSFKAA